MTKGAVHVDSYTCTTVVLFNFYLSILNVAYVRCTLRRNLKQLQNSTITDRLFPFYLLNLLTLTLIVFTFVSVMRQSTRSGECAFLCL